jgi:hypothetical protein
MLQAHIIDRCNTTKQLAQVINQAKMSASCVVNYGSYNQTLSFYTQRRTYLVDDTGELEMGSRYQDSKGWFLNRDEFERLFQSGRQAWVVFKTKRPGRSRELGSDHGSVIG